MGEIVKVTLFESGHRGYGDSQRVKNFRYNRVHGSIDPRWPGQLRMGRGITKVVATNHDYVPVFAVQWTSADDTTTPKIYYLVGQKIRRIQNGADAEIGSDALGSVVVTGMFHDNGSGVPYIYAGFGGSSEAFIRRMDKDHSVAASTDVRADLLLSLNGSAYATVTPTGGTANSQIRVCPFGSDPISDANWGAGKTVGFPGTEINALAGLRQTPVAIKPEGIFGYDSKLDKWVNFTPSWEHFPHPDNGKGGVLALGDYLVVTMGDGGVIIFDGYSARPADPLPLDATPNLHTTGGSMSSLGYLHHWIVAATKSMTKGISAGSALRMFEEASTTFTDGSSAIRDTNPNTELDVGDVGAGDDDNNVWVMWTRPFTAVRFTGTANSTTTALTCAVGQSDGSYTTVTTRDFTTLSDASLGQDGIIVMTEDPVGVRSWAQTTVNSVTGYWLRMRFDNGLSAGTAWKTCQIQPWYPSVDDTNYPLDGLDKSGCFPHILFSLAALGEPVWHDMGSLPEPDEIGPILFADVGGTSMNQARQLWLIGRYGDWRFDTAPGDRPDSEGAPYLNNVGLYEGSAGPPQDGKVARLRKLWINGEAFDTNLTGRFYYTWDWGKPWGRALTFQQVPAELKGGDQRGQVFRWNVGWTQSSVAAALTQSQITSIEAEFEILDVPLSSVMERQLQTQPRF